ncbi:threonine deaminase [Exophiala dermatitidis]|uniref:Threonine dehydratase n=2 Tax=Exophiala dermatitidis TaxID=5970 RepID=H6BJZ7_EXODN|nr:threonine ammonia-lyase, biosynthetic [Exophiala dermatitidis NIH/UT8656]KAJ4512543.1 threonine deaminase [Exophiala dermatitidis]EHY52451.1 threonine ammonia-lyase, biosynthetic [Exophiala dermatitidis NIH/UT8656]KAJ4512583.1 threonine deaminase [Exophiala dermatitidis]KAJ4542378.1 threonine deaminase [Exophiala dermatitidis]KAJ4546681.1 threonine deaminase [Exophiala dermatitidis]
MDLDDPQVNGTTTPSTPKPSGLALTEYTAMPTPPSERADIPAYDVPRDFLLPNGHPDYLRLILTSRVYDVVSESPLSHAVNLSNRLECKVLLKREDLLPVFSFKLRGAYNKMAHLPPEARWKGVIACSAGNHAQGVAYSARHLKIPATIVMPQGTPAIKHLNVSRMGGSVVLHGADFDSAKEHCHMLEKQYGLTNIPPFDDPYVIAGQGTIGMELLRQASLQKLQAIFCCVGGGGLIAGIGVYVKRIAPHVKIIGVEASDANALVQSLKAGKRVLLREVGLFADGAAVKTVGEETFRLCQEVVDEVIQVSTDEICAAIKDVFEDTRSVLEPAGALSLAGLKKWVAQNPSEDASRELVAVASGANMNFDRLRFVAERASLGEQKEALLTVEIPERPGSFAQLIEAVLPQAVTEFGYRYSSSEKAHVLMGISVFSANARATELESLFSRLAAEGMTATDVSDDELAKTHIRHLAGGRSGVPDERLYMFEFPERPGALFKFLRTLRPGQSITLFHYRNYGGDVGKILAGIQCPESEKDQLEDFLKDIGYPFRECTDSPIYKTFLRE